MNKAQLLREALRIVEDRGSAYGPPARHFARTVGAINAVLGHKLAAPLTPADWATMMILDKLAREQHTPRADNPLDIAGYAACLAECREEAEPISGEVGDEWTERAFTLLSSMESLVREARSIPCEVEARR
jgi:hypothetical protein